jgi:hypothetical protein
MARARRRLLGRKEARMGAWTTIAELAADGHVGENRLYELAKRRDDPLPLRYLPGARYGQVLVSEFDEWVKRNTTLANERSDA